MAKVSDVILVSVLFSVFILKSATLWAAESEGKEGKVSAAQKSLEQTIPLTVANLKGHETLYKEGWFVITSSDKALEYAKQHSIDSSAQAITKAKQSIASRTEQYQAEVTEAVLSSVDRAKNLSNKGKQNTQDIFNATNLVSTQTWEHSGDRAVKAWQSVINGYLYLSDATDESLNALQQVPNDYQGNVKDDFNELFVKYQSLRDASTTDIQAQWDDALTLGEENFKQAYESSGQENNSLAGLGTLLWGYANSVYLGLFKPAANTSWQVTKYSAVIAGEAVFLPIASTYILTKNTLRSSGLTFYYTGLTTIEILAPTVKGGFHAGVSLISAGAAPITYIGGTSLGMINQAASLVTAPVVAAGEGVAKTTVDTLQYGALVTYDVVAGTTKVFVNQFQSGVVLGYNALTAIPSHLLLGTANSAVFLFYDGPRLSLATLKGQVNYKGNSLQPGALSVGSVVDLKALSSQSQMELEIISTDPELIEKVLTQLPKDLKL